MTIKPHSPIACTLVLSIALGAPLANAGRHGVGTALVQQRGH